MLHTATWPNNQENLPQKMTELEGLIRAHTSPTDLDLWPSKI